MLTRLKVNGFKNLVDVDVRFGPFTCIAGVNGSGKSNLFDAIRFLAALAEKPLVEATLSVRGPGGNHDIRSLFHRVGDQYADEMSFEAEMIVPSEGVDDLGQPVRTGTTLFRYVLTLTYQAYESARLQHMPLRIVREELSAVDLSASQHAIRFPYGDAWAESAVRADRSPQYPFISTMNEPFSQQIIRLHLDGAASQHGPEADFFAKSLTRTTLSSVDASDSAAATMAQQEMRSWRVLHLDPSAMRLPSYRVLDPPLLRDDGYGFVRLLQAIANTLPNTGRDPHEAETAVYARVGGAIWDLLGEVVEISVESVNERGELGLMVTQRDGTKHSARALSDGTLRFLALAVLMEFETPGLYCIEEPENGIHPGRIQALLDLLQAIAVDTRYPIEEGNPLRQVIISTHSPSVVMRVPSDSLVVAELRESHDSRGRFKRTRFSGLAKSWRDPSPSRTSLGVGMLLDYLNPEGYRPLPEPDPERDPNADTRIMGHPGIREMLSPVPRLHD